MNDKSHVRLACEGAGVESAAVAGDHDRGVFPWRDLCRITYHNYCHYIDFIAIMKCLRLINVLRVKVQVLYV